MEPQAHDWTCSVCAFTWTANATGIDPTLTRADAGVLIGYPECVNETYGCMSAQCLIDAYATLGVEALQSWVTYEQAYTICERYTGVINPVGMYHFMAIRGVQGSSLWVANSAPGYRGVYDLLDKGAFTALGPVQIIALYERN